MDTDPIDDPESVEDLKKESAPIKTDADAEHKENDLSVGKQNDKPVPESMHSLCV